MFFLILFTALISFTLGLCFNYVIMAIKDLDDFLNQRVLEEHQYEKLMKEKQKREEPIFQDTFKKSNDEMKDLKAKLIKKK